MRSRATWCVATLHANNSYNALNRIISFFPIENRAVAAADLAATITRDRVAAAGAGHRRRPTRAAVEVMLNTRHVAELIEKGEIGQIKEAMEKSMSPGSQTFEQALLLLIRDGVVTQEEALANADSASNLLLAAQQRAGRASAKPADKPAQDEGATFTEFTLNI